MRFAHGSRSVEGVTDPAPLSAPHPDGTAPPELDARQRRAILIAVCTALMAVVASASALNVVQPQLARDLGATQSEVLWILNAYVVALAALLLPLGAVADRWGRRRVLLIGLVIFTAATVAAAFAGSVEAMIAARIVAGVSAAMIMPVTLSVITSSFPDAARSQAIGTWTAVAGGGGMLGMIAAAVLVDLASWRALFVLPAALAGAALLLALRAVPDSREPARGSFDLPGALLSAAGIGGLVIGVQQGPIDGWLQPLTAGALAVGVAGLGGFAVHELRHRAPLLELRLFRDLRLASGTATLLLVFAVSAGVFVVLFPFLQAVLGWSALHSMAGLLPLIALMMVAAGLAPKLAAAVSARATVITGTATMAAGLAAMALLASPDAYRSIVPGLLLIGLGMGLAMTPATEAITAALPRDRQGVASALNDTTRELGSALGVAILGAYFAASYASAIDARASELAPGSAPIARSGIEQAYALATQQPGDGGAALAAAAREAFVDGWATSMWLGAAGMMVLCLVLIRVLPRAERGAVAAAGLSAQPPTQAETPGA